MIQRKVPEYVEFTHKDITSRYTLIRVNDDFTTVRVIKGPIVNGRLKLSMDTWEDYRLNNSMNINDSIAKLNTKLNGEADE